MSINESRQGRYKSCVIPARRDYAFSRTLATRRNSQRLASSHFFFINNSPIDNSPASFLSKRARERIVFIFLSPPLSPPFPPSIRLLADRAPPISSTRDSLSLLRSGFCRRSRFWRKMVVATSTPPLRSMKVRIEYFDPFFLSFRSPESLLACAPLFRLSG